MLWTFRSSLASNDMAYRPADFSFTPTLNNYRQLFVEQNFQHNLWNSFWIAVVCASICLGGRIARCSHRSFLIQAALRFPCYSGHSDVASGSAGHSVLLDRPQTIDIGGYEIKMFDRGITLAIIYLSFNLPFVVWIFRFLRIDPDRSGRSRAGRRSDTLPRISASYSAIGIAGTHGSGIFAFVLS